MKTINKAHALLMLSMVAVLAFGCKKTEEEPKVNDPTLSINPSETTVYFAAAGEDYPIIVTTNQDSWSVKLEPENGWLNYNKDNDKLFTLSADPNTSTTAPADIIVTVTAGTATPVIITAKQRAFVPGPYLNVDPEELRTLEFSAAATENFIFEVDTNESSWDAQSDKTWVKIAKAGNKFTVTADANTATSSPEAATITVTAGEATPITIAVTQEPVQVAVLIKSPDTSFDWAAGDKIGVVAEYGDTKQSSIYTVDAVAGGFASFTGELNWKGGEHTFYAYYPVDQEVEDAKAVKVSVPATQTQAGASDDHLAAMSLMVAEPVKKGTPANANDEAAATVELTFHDVLATLEFRLASFDNAFKKGAFTLNYINIAAPDGEVLSVIDASVDATLASTAAGFGKLTGGTASNKVKLNVTGTPPVPDTDNETNPASVFSALAKIAPSNLSGKTLTVTVVGKEGDDAVIYNFEVDGADYKAGQSYANTLVMVAEEEIAPIVNENLLGVAHTVPGYGTMYSSGFGTNERNAITFLSERSGSGQPNWNYWGTLIKEEPHTEFAILKIKQRQDINQMRLWARSGFASEFPVSFKLYATIEDLDLTKPTETINVRYDDPYGGWGEPILVVENCIPGSDDFPYAGPVLNGNVGGMLFDFPATKALYVKFEITSEPTVNGKYTSSVGELDLLFAE